MSEIKIAYKEFLRRPEFNNRFGVGNYLRLDVETRSGLRNAVRICMDTVKTKDKNEFKQKVTNLIGNNVDLRELYEEVHRCGYDEPEKGLNSILNIVMLELGHHLKYQTVARSLNES